MTRIPTVYRCSIPYWKEFGLDGLKPVLSQVDTLMISNRGWNFLRQNVSPRPVSSLRTVTDASLIIQQSRNKYRLSRVGEKDQLYSFDAVAPDITSRFTASILIKLAERVDISDAIEYAIKAENE